MNLFTLNKRHIDKNMDLNIYLINQITYKYSDKLIEQFSNCKDSIEKQQLKIV
jgi:hypothetical protein